MSLKKHDVVVHCEHCTYQSSEGLGTFDVTVPLNDGRSGMNGIARLRCTVEPDRHEVDLKEWQDDKLQPIEPPAEIKMRLSQVLDFVAEKRVCGNRNICPASVVRIVERQKQH
jgi:hypothetical protein